jgi:hypothetical protein
MKGIPFLTATCILLWSVCPARAQTPLTLPHATTPRPDIAGSIGWLSVNKSQLNDRDSNDWYNRSAQAALMFGWYWSPHIKTEVEVSASTEAELYGIREELVNGSRFITAREYGFATRRLTVGGQYQFGENAWFHPHVATGIDINWEKVRRLDRDVYVYDPVARVSRIVQLAVRHPAEIEAHVRPYVATGFKAYFTQRGFVRSDLRLTFGKQVEDAVIRFGIGVDF